MGYFTKKNGVFTFLLFSFIFFSCSKDLISPTERDVEDYVKSAENYHRSTNVKLKSFVNPFQTKSSEGATYTAVWNDCYIRDHDSIIYVEVPLFCSIYEKVNYNGKELDATSRLIVEYKKKTGVYSQTIITKIWNSGTPDLKGRSIGGYDINSLCFIYNVNGEMISDFEILDNKIIPFSIVQNSDFKKSYSDRLIIDGSSLLLRKSVLTKKAETKVVNGICRLCNTYNGPNIYTCRSCGVGTMEVSRDYQEFFAHMSSQIISLTMQVASEVDCYGHCESFMLDISCEALYMSYSRFISYDLLERYYSASFQFTDYYFSGAELVFYDSRIYHDSKWINGVYYTFYYSPYFALLDKIYNESFRYKSNLHSLYSKRRSEVCHHEKCTTCYGCFLSDNNDSNCKMCDHTALECKKCPWCNKCVHLKYPMTNCTYCPNATHHKLLYDITTKCSYAIQKFEVENDSYLMGSLEYWQTLDDGCYYINMTSIGVNLWSAIDIKFFFRYEWDIDRGSMDYTNKVMTLSYSLLSPNNSYSTSATIFHEMFHYKQFMDCGDYAHAMGNKEAEAKMAKIIFADQLGMTDEQAHDPLEMDFIKKCRRLIYFIDDDGVIKLDYIKDFNTIYTEILNDLYDLNYGSVSYIEGNNAIKTLKTLFNN